MKKKITDKMRLDWILKNAAEACKFTGFDDPVYCYWIHFRQYVSDSKKTPRQAIDAAILAEAKGAG